MTPTTARTEIRGAATPLPLNTLHFGIRYGGAMIESLDELLELLDQ